jgi:hypothetical protein
VGISFFGGSPQKLFGLAAASCQMANGPPKVQKRKKDKRGQFDPQRSKTSTSPQSKQLLPFYIVVYKYKSIWQERRWERMKEFQGCRKSLSISLWIGRVLRRDWPPSLDQIKMQFHIPPHFLKFEGPHKKKLMKVHTTTTAVFVINRKRFKYFPFFYFVVYVGVPVPVFFI